MHKIKDTTLDDRPRERLINYGVESLSNEELLAIVLKTGTNKLPVKDLSALILNKIDGIKKLANINYQMLLSIPGIGTAKACSLIAIVEIAKRINQERSSINNTFITSSTIAFEYFKYLFKDKLQEYFYVVYLDNKKKVIENKLLFIGTLNQSIVHPREVFKEACLLSASSLICVHNHPSGNVIPSKEDIETTKRIYSIGELMGIKLVDHLIIGSDKYYSFLENSLI